MIVSSYWLQNLALITFKIVDNVVRKGRVADLSMDDSSSQGLRSLFEIIKTDQEVEATIISTVGSKGWDGFMMAYLK